MQKFLRTLMLAVAMLLPFASQAQTDCTSPQTVPYSENFDAYTGNATSTSAPTGYPAITLPDCWSFLNMSATTSTYPQVFLSSSTTYAVSGNCLFFKSGKNMRLFAVLPAVSASATETYELTFMYRNEGTTAYNGTLIVGLMTDVTDSTTFVALDTCARTTTKTEKAVTITGAQLAGARVAICYLGGTSQNYYAAIDNVSLHIAPTCFPVTNLAVTAATTSSMTLTWADAINTTATYIVYDMSDTSVVFSGISDTTYTVTGLDAATNYTFGVASDCGGGDVTAIVTVSGATGCDAITSFPWSEDFESYDASSSGVTFSNPCWVNEHISGSGSYFFEVYSSTSGTGGNTTKMLRLHDMSSGTMTKLALPMMDIPVGSNYIFSLDIYRNATGSSYLGEGIRVFVSTDGEIEGATELAFISRNYTVTDSNLIPAEAASGWYNYELPLGVSGSCYIILRGESKYGSATYMDNFVVMEAPSCAAVTGLTMTGATPNSITLGWTDASNTGASYVVYDMSDTSVVYDVVVTDTSAEIFNLTPNTVYTFGVAADCGGDEASIRTVSARTACAPMELPWSEDFSTSVTNDPCWSGATKLASEVFAGQSLTLTTPQWTYASTTRDGLAAGHYYKNVYGTSCKSWIITPEIDLSTAVSPMLSFSAAFTKYNAANPAEGDITDDQFLVIVSTDGGQTWLSTNATSISLSSLIGTEYVNQYVDLSAYVGDTVRIAFYAESTVTGGDNDLHIDNITIDEMVGEFCMPVTGLAASAITAEGATLSWNGTAAGSYTVVNMADGSVVTSGADTTYTLTGLTAMTQYSYGVVANCTSSNSDTMVVTFNTACTALTLPYTEGFELTSNAIGCWSVEGTGSWTVGTGDYSASTGAFEGTYNAKITHGTTGNATKLVSPALDGVENGMMLDFAYVMRAWSGDVDELRVYTRSSDTAAWQMAAEYTDAAATWTVANLIIPGTVYQVAFEFTDNYGYGVGIDSVVFTPMSGSFCFPVADLAVDSVTATSVFLSWSDENNTGATYSIYGDEGNVIATNVAGTSYEVTNLIALTGYTFGVAANCSAEESSDVATIGAVTGCASTTCDVYIYAVDGYGDGWNDATIEVKQAGVVVASYSMADQGEEDVTVYDTAVVEVCASAPVALYWISGEYDDEIAFTIADYNGDSLYAVDSASNLIDGATFFNLTAPCGEVEADSLTVVLMVNDSTLGSITPAVGVYRLALGDSITLTATPYGDNVFNGWLTYVDGEVMATLPINPFTFSANVNNVNHTMLMIAQFAAAGAAPDSVTVIINVDNPLMGTTSPAPGTYRVAVGDPLDMVALPNAGFHNLYWIESATFMGTTFTDTLAYDTLNFFASPMMANATLNYTAYFEANPPVESTIDASEITYWVGTGSNQAVVAVNWSNGAYAWGVRFNGESITVQDALDSMAAYDYRFDYSADSYLNNITFDEGNLHLTGLLGSFWESKHNGILDMGLAQTLVNGDFEKWAEPAAGVVTDSVYYDGWGWSYIYTYTMSILPMWAPEPESISLTFNVNDPTLGSINPSGVRIFEVGDELTVTATPAEGCSFVSWTVTTAQGETMTLQRDMASFTDTVEATWNGSTLTANFVRNQGIDEVESADFQAYSLNGKVIVKGVENMDVNVYDVTGRSVNNVAKAAETVEFTVPAAGVYMVKVGNAVKRVVVIR